GQGRVGRLDDFAPVDLARDGDVRRFKGVQDNGHRRELELTIEALRSGKPSPIPFDELVEVTETTFLVRHALATGQVIERTHGASAAPPCASPAETPDVEVRAASSGTLAGA